MNIIAIISLIATIIIISICLAKMLTVESVPFYDDQTGHSEAMRNLGENIAYGSMDSWCTFNCYFTKIDGTNAYELDVESWGDDDVTISFNCSDKNMTMWTPDNINQKFIGNGTWLIYQSVGMETKFIFYIDSNLSENITLTVMKYLQPFDLCPKCEFKPIIRTKTFSQNNIESGYL